MLKIPRTLALLAAPVAVVALGAASYSSVVGFAAASPSPDTASQPASAASERSETITTSEAAGPNEPALAGGGYEDTDINQADTQQEGVN